MLIIEFSYNFLYVWKCMKLYDKKFLIYGNCMRRNLFCDLSCYDSWAMQKIIWWKIFKPKHDLIVSSIQISLLARFRFWIILKLT